MRNELLRLLKDKIYLIILPTTIITATKFEDRQITIKGKQFSINDALTRNNIIFNSTGLPSISIPSGLTKNNLPTGVQIIGAPFEESKILTLAYNYECKNNILDKMIPPLLLK
ncbi:MAG TPA: amidase family protein [Nitrososphaeraceae archaeon]|nr:amidase family protein [Nitrososphaeraceae archaeon]